MFRHILKKNYHKKIVDHFNHPENIGYFDKSLPNIGNGLSTLHGDLIKLQIKVENNIIIDTRIQTFGSGSTIASSSYGSELIKGMSLNNVSNINQQISKHLELNEIKNYSALLMECAIKDAIQNYKLKQVKNKMNDILKDL